MRALWLLIFLFVLLNPVSAGGTVSIVGNDASWNHYSIVVSDSIKPLKGITEEDDVGDFIAKGAVSSSADTYSFEGRIVDIDIENPSKATIVLNGRNTSVAEISGLKKNVSNAVNLSGSQENNSFYVKPGELVSIGEGKHWFYTYAKGDIEFQPINSDDCSSVEKIVFAEQNVSKNYTNCPGKWFSNFERNGSGFVNFTLSVSEKTYFQLKAEKGEKNYEIYENTSNVSGNTATVNLSVFGLRDTQQSVSIYRNGESYYTQQLNITTGTNTFSGEINVTEGFYEVKFDGTSLNNFTVSSRTSEDYNITEKASNESETEENSSDTLYLIIGLIAIILFIGVSLAILSLPYLAYRNRKMIISRIQVFASGSKLKLEGLKETVQRKTESIQTWWNGREFEPEREKTEYRGPNFTSEDE